MFGYRLIGDSNGRDYTVIDFTSPLSVGAEVDREINFMEFVRQNFAQLVEGIPPGSELCLVAGGHAHNPGLVPLLVLWVPPESRGRVPDRFDMIESIDRWCAALTPDEILTILNTTYAPTWAQLLNVERYPHRHFKSRHEARRSE